MINFPYLGRCGRLGNQLWQIASTLGIAAAKGDSASFPPWAYQPYFNLPKELFGDQPGENPEDFCPHIDYRARIYLQDYGLWEDIAPQVKTWMQPSNYALQTLHEFEDFWALEPPVTSLHVRRGDNLTDGPWKADYHPLRPLSYYDEALQSLHYQSLAVFSDDIPWCKEQFGDRAQYYHEGVAHPKEHEPDYETAPNLDWIDLQLMTFCDYHVISNSTYSWWGAYLSDDASPIYPLPWFGPALSYIDAPLMFPSNWKPIHHAV